MREHILFGLCLLLGCSSPQIKPDPPEPTRGEQPSRDVFLGVDTAALGGGEWQLVVPGATLSSGTQLAVRIKVAAPAYAFIGLRSSGGTIEILHPQAGAPAARAEPAQPLLLPGPGKWFTLDERQGEEALFLVTQATPDSAAAQQLLRERGEASCVKTRDPPPPDVKIRDRGFSVRGTMGEDGIAVLCVPYHHR